MRDYLQLMKNIVKVNDIDKESNHGHADTLLCELLKELGYKELIEEYDKITKWYA